jgi:ribose transport system substrate-binding protein
MKPRLYLTAAALALAAILTACSSSPNAAPSATSSGTASASQAAAASSGVAQARQLVAAAEKDPTSVGVTEPVGKPIPKGKTIAFMECGVPTCTSYASILKPAVQALGWKFEVIPAGISPEQVASAWATVARMLPSAVIGIGYPRTIFQTSLGVLQAHHIPVVECCDSDTAGNGILYVAGNPAQVAPEGTLMADWIIADTNGQAHALFVDDKDYPVVGAALTAFQAEMARLCPACTTAVYEAQTADIGTSLPSQLVGYLRAHPDINYLANGVDSMATGLPAALASAGLTGKVKFIGQTGDPLNKNYTAEGIQAADVPFAAYESLYRLVDILARYFAGSTADTQPTPLPIHIYTKQNLQGTNLNAILPLVPNLVSQYHMLWGLSS